jgi:hypothetical protein
MEFDFGSSVTCTDGGAGRVVGLIADPSARALAHIAVEPRHHPEGARLVPVGLVASASLAQVDLRCSLEDFQGLPEFRDVELIPAGAEPFGAELAWPYYGAAGRTQAVLVDRVPAGEVEIRRHEHVHAADGAIGRVEGLVVDDAGQIAHVLLQTGDLWGRKDVAIPLASLERIDTDGIHVRLSKHEVADLPDHTVTETPGEPVSYLALAPRTPVYADGWVAVGRVREVLSDQALDVFDGIIIRTHHGDRFVDADQIDSLYERAVLLKLSAEECGALPRPRPGRRP